MLPARRASQSPTPSSPAEPPQAIRRPGPADDCWQALAETRTKLAAAEDRLAHQHLELVELNHRVANSLALAATFVSFQGRKLADSQARAALAAAGARIASIATFHRRLAHQAGAGSMDLSAFLSELALEIGASGLQCRVDGEPVEVEANVALRIALVINELAINASKHAYGGGGGAFLIRCQRDRTGRLIVSVADDGPGLPNGFDLQDGGLGMSITSAIVRQLGAELRAENLPGGGACFILRLPPNGLQRAEP